ncbi:MAG: hypothetical protein OJF50_000610 [Nitrospira sp.]|nr:hypothetical protein [Nitrospira sp.]
MAVRHTCQFYTNKLRLNIIRAFEMEGVLLQLKSTDNS